MSFTLDRYGHLCPEADTALRDRLDALYVAGVQAKPGQVIELPRDRSRPQRGPATGGAPPMLLWRRSDLQRCGVEVRRFGPLASSVRARTGSPLCGAAFA